MNFPTRFYVGGELYLSHPFLMSGRLAPFPIIGYANSLVMQREMQQGTVIDYCAFEPIDTGPDRRLKNLHEAAFKNAEGEFEAVLTVDAAWIAATVLREDKAEAVLPLFKHFPLLDLKEYRNTLHMLERTTYDDAVVHALLVRNKALGERWDSLHEDTRWNIYAAARDAVDYQPQFSGFDLCPLPPEVLDMITHTLLNMTGGDSNARH